MTEEKKSLGSYFTKKIVVTLAAVASVLSIIGGIWAFEAHYATNKRVDNVVNISLKSVKDTAMSSVEELEIQVAGALQNQQLKGDARYFQFMYDKLTADMWELKRQMRRYPEDEILRQDYRDLLERRKDVKKKLDESIEKIKVQ